MRIPTLSFTDMVSDFAYRRGDLGAMAKPVRNSNNNSTSPSTASGENSERSWKRNLKNRFRTARRDDSGYASQTPIHYPMRYAAAQAEATLFVAQQDARLARAQGGDSLTVDTSQGPYAPEQAAALAAHFVTGRTQHEELEDDQESGLHAAVSIHDPSHGPFSPGQAAALAAQFVAGHTQTLNHATSVASSVYSTASIASSASESDDTVTAPPEQSAIDRISDPILRRLEAIKQLAYRADAFECAAAHILQDITHARRNNLHAITISLPGLEPFTSADFTQNEWNWISRWELCDRIKSVCWSGDMSEDDMEDIHEQLMPASLRHLMYRCHFDLFMDVLVKTGRWSEEWGVRMADVVRWQVAPEEMGGASDNYPSQLFRGLSMHEGNGRCDEYRFLELKNLIEAAAFERIDWQYVMYDFPVQEFEKYFAAFEIARQGKKVPSRLASYARDWNFDEQRLLRAGAVVLGLLKQVREQTKVPTMGKDRNSMSYNLFNIIRGTLLQVPGQHSLTLQGFERVLYDRAADNGLSYDRIPGIMVFHHEFDAQVRSMEDEAGIIESLDEHRVLFEIDEKQRLAEIKEAKKAFARATGNNGFRARVKRGISKLFGKKKAGFHCVGCRDGGECIRG